MIIVFAQTALNSFKHTQKSFQAGFEEKKIHIALTVQPFLLDFDFFSLHSQKFSYFNVEKNILFIFFLHGFEKIYCNQKKT